MALVPVLKKLGFTATAVETVKKAYRGFIVNMNRMGLR